ncbi:MAG: hypothetical protein RLZ98_268, partial [Pseudomonadota bacterium]
YLRQIWSSHRLTNNGPLLQELEHALRLQLGVKDTWVVSNCMSALLIAIEAGEVSGEVITTPFSYVATSAAIVWQKCRPVFADIKSNDLTIDPDALERAITPRTRGILATHVYGMPCDVDRLEALARNYGLLLIYDAAHAFGTTYRGRSLASYGDISCLSFHATKVFSTGEGGAVVVNSPDRKLAERVRYMRSFGHMGDDHRMPGINAKCSELHAALGLCNLPLVAGIIAQRVQACALYDQALSGIDVRRIDFSMPGLVHNHAYYPVLFPNEATLLRAQAAMNALQIYPRRYFWPALHRIPYLRSGDCPRADQASATVLCLPLSSETDPALVGQVAESIRSALA